jgi:hypothetical protein
MSLIYWWPFTDNTTDKINGKTFTSTNWSFQSGGKIGKCFTPSWTDSNTISRQIYAESVSIPETFSVAVWVKNNNNFNSPRTYCPIQFSDGDCWLTGANNKGWDFSHNSLRLIFNNGSNVSGSAGNAEVNWGYNPKEFLGSWYHIVFTVNKTTRKAELFINGVSKGIKDLPSAVDTYGGTFKLKINWVQGWMLDGSLNDLRIYDHALSQAEVKELSKALVVHYTFNDVLAEPTTNVSTINGWSSYTSYFVISERTETGLKVYRPTNSTNTVLALSNSAVTGKMAAGEIWTFSCYLYVDGKPYKCTQSDMSTYKYSGINYYSNDDGYYTCTFTVGTPEAWIIHAPMFGSVGTNVMCEIDKIQFEKKDHATPYTPTSRESMLQNEAGYSAPDAVTALQLSTTANNGSYSGYFDGQTSCIDTPVIKANMFTEDYTLSLWVYPLDSGRAVYFGDHQISSVSTINFERTADGAFRYYHNGSPDKSFANTNTPEKTWTMLTVTYTPGTMKVYKNGVLAETLSHTATITKNINGIMRIGRDNRTGSDYGATPLYGYISDFRFYVTCLSAGDVQELYKTKAYVTDKGDIMCGEFVENKTEAGVTEKSIFECNETQEKLNIPGFELLDGILIEKNPYFDTGLVFGDVNTSIYVDAEVTPTNTSGNNCLAGSGNSSWNGPIMLNFCGGKMEFGTSGYSTSTEPQGKFAANERLTVQAEIYPTTQKWYKNNVQINNITQRTRTTTTATFAIGTFKTPSGTVGASNSFKGYIHRFYVKYGDEVRCYLPAKRKSDNVYGLYDIHTKTFLVNSGGGTVSGTASTLCDKAAIYQSGCISGREIIEL